MKTFIIRLTFALAVVIASSIARAGNTWDGGGGDNNWGTAANWNPDGAPGYGTLIFSGTTQTTNNNNSITAMNQVNWNGTAAWVLNGSTTLSLFDNGGTQAKLESLGTGGVTINAPITFAANNGGPPNPFGEINALNSGISFTGGTLTVNGSSVNGIKLFGGAGMDVTFANTVSAAGKWFGFTDTNGSSVTIATGASVTTGDFYVMNGGTLNLSGGTLTTSAVRLGGDFGNTGNQNQTFDGTLALTPAAGGISFSSAINTVSGNTSNALLVHSQNTSGTNTLTSGIFLDSDLKIQQAAGGSLTTSTGTFDVKTSKLTVDSGSGGAVTVSQALTSSSGAGGFLLKQGNGSLILSNTANTYTGTNAATLNANGTQIAGGTLGIHGDTSLGLAPSGAYNNIQFLSSGTLQDTANNISLNANRNISISAGTATFDSNGNTFTINGVINGAAGNTRIIGAGGTVVFAGANSYGGTTTISSGTLQIGNGLTGQLGAGAVTNNSALVFNRSNLLTVTNTIGGTGTVTQSGVGTTIVSGSNSYSGTTAITQGVMEVTSNNGLGTAASGTTVSSGAALKLTSVSYTTPEALSINGIGVVANSGALVISGPVTYAGQITAASNATIFTTGGVLDATGGIVKNGTTLTIAGTGQVNVLTTGISGAAANSDLVIDAATVVLSAASTYNGPTTIQNGGTLRLGASNVLPTSPHTAMTLYNTGNAIGRFDLAGFSDSVASINATVANNPVIITNTAIGTTSVLTVGASNGSGEWWGTITEYNGGMVQLGTIALVKIGTGTQTMRNPGYFSGGITVNAGTLNISTQSDPYQGPITVASAGTLAGNNAIIDTSVGGNLMVLNGALVVGDSTLGSPVASLIRIDSTGAGSTIMGAGSFVYMDLFGGAGLGGGIADQIRLFGTFDTANFGTLVLGNPNSMSGWLAGDQWTLFDLVGAGNMPNNFLAINDSALGLGGGLIGNFDKTTGVYYLTAVPEPSRLMLLGLGAFGLFFCRRR